MNAKEACAKFNKENQKMYVRFRDFEIGWKAALKITKVKDCDVCNNGTVRLASFPPDKYIYCPWCSRELPDA
jgi:hypothetical protein